MAWNPNVSDERFSPMNDAERIQGKSRYGILSQLQQDKTILTMHVLGKNFERLTLITGVHTEHGVPYFQLDYPRGFREAVAGLKTWRIYFECTGKDKILYVFRTYGGKIEKGDIWINFPQYIERQQRRRHFRLKAPAGTKLLINTDTQPRELSVVNISQGGVLGAVDRVDPETEGGLTLRVGQSVKNMELIIPFQDTEHQLFIRKAMVRRVGRETVGGNTVYGLEFTNLKKADEKRLTELIYSYQRALLQKGLRVYE